MKKLSRNPREGKRPLSVFFFLLSTPVLEEFSKEDREKMAQRKNISYICCLYPGIWDSIQGCM
jgi:hypothetical protein